MAMAWLARQRRATVAVEVALVLPIYLVLVFGLVDIGRFFIWLDQARRVAFVSGNAASQCCTVQNPTTGALSVQVAASDMLTILTQAGMAAPAASWGATNGLIMTEMTTNSGGTATSEVQQKYPTNLAQTSAYTCFAGKGNVSLSYDPGDTVVVTELFYTFTPFIFLSQVTSLGGTITIHDNSVMRARQPVVLTSATTC